MQVISSIFKTTLFAWFALGLSWSASHAQPVFKKITLSTAYYGEGGTTGDVNKDGKTDVVAGPYWFAGPDFATGKHEYYTPKAFSIDGYAEKFLPFVYDFNGDSWPDILMVGFPGKEVSWYQNPGAGLETVGVWKMNLILNGVDNESPLFRDLTGDGKPELVFMNGGRLCWAGPTSGSPATTWTIHPISTVDTTWGQYTHGLGVGDVNGDGRMDVLEKGGWWEQPASLVSDPVWVGHSYSFTDNMASDQPPGGGQMYVYDVDGDGDGDVITSLQAHGWGLAWFENVIQAGQVTFIRHLIMGLKATDGSSGITIPGMHAVELTDMDGDGLKDIVTGSRIGTHGPSGTGVYWIGMKRQGASVTFTPHSLDAVSGIGVHLAVGDLGNDGRQGVVVVNKNGIFAYRRSDVVALSSEGKAARAVLGAQKSSNEIDGLGRKFEPAKKGILKVKARGFSSMLKGNEK